MGEFDDARMVFIENNPHCKVILEEEKIRLMNPWGGEEECNVDFKVSDPVGIDILRNMIFKPKFDAVFHLDSNQVEFLFGYILLDDPLVGLKFDFFLDGKRFSCRFDLPTDRLLKIATSISFLPWSEVVPQLKEFRDAQRLDKLPDSAKEYFSRRKAQNFFITTEDAVGIQDVERVSKHLNFLTKYYDRRFPTIVVRADAEKVTEDVPAHKRYCEERFPATIVARDTDDFLLQLIQVARETAPRSAFIYYYQVIEYVGFYFIDDKVRKTLRHLLRDPAVVECFEDRMASVFPILTESAHSDEVKMRKVVEELCLPDVIWKEIENDKDFFTMPTVFEGGFTLQPLISKDTTRSSWETMWMPKFFDQLTKLRNCLVHAREKRQDNLILPTNANNLKIRRWVPLISRLAEQIVIKRD